jgi:hypothetical protein
MDAGMTGVRLPTSSGSDLPEVTTRRIDASQAIRLAAVPETTPAWSSSAPSPLRELFGRDRDRDVWSLSSHARAIR